MYNSELQVKGSINYTLLWAFTAYTYNIQEKCATYTIGKLCNVPE